MRITYCNDGFCELFGGTREGFARRGDFDPMAWVFNADLPVLCQRISEMLRSGAPCDCSFRIHTLSDGFKRVNYMATVTQRDEGRVTANAILLDITKTQRSLEQLRMSEEENTFAVQHGGNIVCRYTVADRTLSISPALARQHGIPERIEDVPDSPIRLGLVSPETADAFSAFFEAIHKGSAVGSVLYQQRYFHDLRWTEAKSSTIFSADGKPVKAGISLFDVTNRINKETIYKK